MENGPIADVDQKRHFNSGGRKIFNVMDNLGSESFWKEMEERFPMAVDVFKNWISKYSNTDLWTSLFKDGVSFYDLPYDMQMGMMNRFFIETYAGKKEYMTNCIPRYREEMVTSIEQLNGRLRPMQGMN